MRKLAVVAGLLALVAAWASPSSAADDDGWQRIRPRGMGWTVRVPASWHAVVVPSVSLQVVNISNQEMMDPCVTDETGTRCGGNPISQLEDDGVLVSWVSGSGGYMTDAQHKEWFRDAAGTPTTIDGQPAKIDAGAMDARPCEGIAGVERTVSAAILVDKRIPVGIVACLRGPHLDRASTRVIKALRSIRFAG